MEGPIDADDGDVLTQWALAGLGIAMKPLYEVAAYIAQGRLVEIMPQVKPTTLTLGILYPSRRMLPPRAKAFIELAADELRTYIGAELARLEGRRAPPPGA